MNSVVHFEMPAEDRRRMSDFYTKVFGWKTNQLGEEYGGYVTVMTTEGDKTGRPKNPGAINGGFYQKTKDTSPHPSVVIAVEDVNKAMESIKNAGGKIIGEPTDIPKVGLYVSFVDTEGNRISILQPSPMM